MAGVQQNQVNVSISNAYKKHCLKFGLNNVFLFTRYLQTLKLKKIYTARLKCIVQKQYLKNIQVELYPKYVYNVFG